MHSIDAPRERYAPRRYRGESLAGELVESELGSLTLIVAVKSDCHGCRSVLESARDAFGAVSTLVVARETSLEPWWATSRHPLVISPSLLDELEVRWPPFYVLVDPHDEKVVTEGVVFAPEQVREEIAAYLV